MKKIINENDFEWVKIARHKVAIHSIKIWPNKINILFPVTCWGKRGSDGRKTKYFKEKFYNLSETKTNLNSHNNL